MSGAALLVALLIGAGPARPVDFDTEIIPVLTKAGCNAGACHGAAAGRGGFRLSLLGGDAAADYESIVDDSADQIGIGSAFSVKLTHASADFSQAGDIEAAQPDLRGPRIVQPSIC